MSLLFIAIAAALNALMDTVENENFYASRLRNLDQRFWYKRESWKYRTRYLGYRFDAWHMAKSLMVVCLALAVVTFEGSPITGFINAGIIWNATFLIFYYKVFRA